MCEWTIPDSVFGEHKCIVSMALTSLTNNSFVLACHSTSHKYFSIALGNLAHAEGSQTSMFFQPDAEWSNHHTLTEDGLPLVLTSVFNLRKWYLVRRAQTFV